MAENESDDEDVDEGDVIDIRKRRSTDDISQDDIGNNGLSYLKDNQQDMKFQMQNIEQFLDESKKIPKCGQSAKKSFDELREVKEKLQAQMKAINPTDALSKQKKHIKSINDFHHNGIKPSIDCQLTWGKKLVDQFGRNKYLGEPREVDSNGRRFQKPQDCKIPCE